VLDYFFLFLAGFFQDILLTSYQKCVARDLKIRAALISGVIAVVGILVISRVLQQMNLGNAGTRLACYASGKMLGTYFSLRFFKSFRLKTRAADIECQQVNHEKAFGTSTNPQQELGSHGHSNGSQGANAPLQRRRSGHLPKDIRKL